MCNCRGACANRLLCVIRRLIRAPLQLAVLVLFAFTSSSFAYGPLGHEIVGAIADRKLAGTPTAEEIKTLLDGIPLERASLIADDIKSWDKNGPDDRRGIHFLAHPEIEQQLHDFWKANPPSPDAGDTTPSHHWMHYTDVPVLDAEKYGDGKTGRGNWDIVHTIPYCIGVLRGEIAADNPRKITKAIAVILLAHYLGDIHQPLHVGAEYFNEAGEPIDPRPWRSRPGRRRRKRFNFGAECDGGAQAALLSFLPRVLGFGYGAQFNNRDAGRGSKRRA